MDRRNLTDIQRMLWQQVTTDLRKVHVVDSKKTTEIFARNDVWLSVRGEGWNGMKDGDLMVSVAPAPGGGWYAHGRGHVHEDRIEFKLDSVYDIMATKTGSELHVFEFCNPSFPDNMYAFLKRYSINARRADELKHKRSWQRTHRDLRQRRLTEQ